MNSEYDPSFIAGCCRLKHAVFGDTQMLIDERVVHQVTMALAIPSMSARESAILRMRFGIDPPYQKMSLADVGARFDVSSERIRHIEAKVLRKLRHPKHKPIWEKSV